MPVVLMEPRLLASLNELLAYARHRVGDPDVAADLVQDSLLKALQAAPALRDEDGVLPWFYRILNNTITDYYRRRGTARQYPDPRAAEIEAVAPVAEAETLCRCLYPLLDTMNPDYAFLIRTLELDEGDPAAVADRLGLTRNHLKVKRHRARQQLRQRLEATCRACAPHGCLDCHCRPARSAT